MDKNIESKINEFKNFINEKHRQGLFKGDHHTMDRIFKPKKTIVDFISIMREDGFVALDIFTDSKGNKFGMIRCLGVPNTHRGKGISNELMRDIEEIGKKSHPDMKMLVSTCNEISAKSHIKNGWIITNPGRPTKSGDMCMIKLKKDL